MSETVTSTETTTTVTTLPTPRLLFGRKIIYTDVEVITSDNVISVLNDSLTWHQRNQADIDYLDLYYRGIQPILARTKEIRPEICNRLVVNRANQAVSFKTGYLMGEPIQYICRSDDKQDVDNVKVLNDYMFAEDKHAKDVELTKWAYKCGTAYRLILPDAAGQQDESPFEIYTLDPRYTFIVYSSGVTHKPMMAVMAIQRVDGVIQYVIYTDTSYYEIENNTIVTVKPNPAGMIPIIEYPANPERLSAIEIVLPIFDALNLIDSNRIDSIEQFIQAILVLKGTNLPDNLFSKIRDYGGLKLPPDGDAKYLTQELNQSQVQTIVDYLDKAWLKICGMPDRNGGSSTSDTGTAVIYRDGWSDAESRAKETENMFKLAEKQMLKLVINISNTLKRTNVRLSSIDIHFTRRNYENITLKSQVLTSMLASNKIHPKLAFQYCNMFVDPEEAYLISKQYNDEYQNKMERELKQTPDSGDETEPTQDNNEGTDGSGTAV